MSAMHADSAAMPVSQEAKVRVTVESTATPVGASSMKVGSEQKHQSKSETSQSSMTQILSSLAETRKYLPNQVYTFLESVEGKTLDDLRLEAVNLANKAQEEAKKRTGDVKNIVDNANIKVMDAADMARSKTTDIASDLAQKSKDLVQPPIDMTKEATMSVANRVNETTTGLAMKGLDTAQRLAMRGYAMVSTRIVPVVQPVASRAVEYLPSPAKDFVHQNIEGKSLDELRTMAVLTTRKNLLSAKDEIVPDLPSLVGEVKTATLSGELFNNAIGLSEKAADKMFGQVDIPKDFGSLRRMFNLSTRVTGGMWDYAFSQVNNMNEQAKGMVLSRAYQIGQMAGSRTESVRGTISPVLERIGATPIVPGFIYRYLRGESSMPQNNLMGGSRAMSAGGVGTSAGLDMDKSLETEKKTTTTATIPTTTVRVDIIGTKPGEASKTETKSTTTAAFGGANASMDLKDMKPSSDPIGNTNAQGMGSLGSAGMGVTTTGSEDKTSTEMNTSATADSEGAEQHKESSKKDKKHQKNQNKM